VSRKLSLVLPFLIAAVGVALIVYPYVSDWYHKGIVARDMASYDEEVESQDTSYLQDEMARAQEYNKKLNESYTIVTDPFDPNAGRIPGENYEDILNLRGDGVMATLFIPKISVALPIYHGTDSATLTRGVGHMETTSLPVGGESTHAVLAGHDGLQSMKIFDDLPKLEVGDYFIIEVLGEDHAYRITSIETVLPDETQSCSIQQGKDLVTLVTCVPYGVNTHRLLVHAERCEVPQEWLDQGKEETVAASQASTRTPLIVFSLIGAAIAVILILLYKRVRKRRERRKAVMAASAPRHMASSVDGDANKKQRKDSNGKGRH
jgi:sortase A